MRPGRLPGTFIVVLLLVLGGAGSAHAQEDIDLRFFRPQVTVAGDTFQDKPFDKGSGEFGAGSLSLFANLPLGRTHVRWDRKYRASQFFAHVAANSASPDITFLAGPQHRLYSGVLAASGVWLSRANNLYVASAGESFAEDDRIEPARIWLDVRRPDVESVGNVHADDERPERFSQPDA